MAGKIPRNLLSRMRKQDLRILPSRELRIAASMFPSLKVLRGESLMFLFNRKTPETEEATPTPSLANVTLEDLENFDEATFKQTVQTTPTDELRARLDALSKYLHKLPVKPLEKVEERQQRRAKLHRLMSIISIEVRQRDEETKKKAVADAQKWVRETVPAQLANLRICREATLLKDGLHNLSVVRWETPTDTTLTLKTTNGYEQKFDLLSMPAPFLRQLLSAPFNPIFIGYGGSTKRGVPHSGGWENGTDFQEAMSIKPRPLQYWALMVV